MDKFEGKEVIINSPSSTIFSQFSDLTLLANRLPQEYKEKVEVTPDTVSGDVQGMRMGLEITERVPFSKVVMKPQNGFPFDFSLIFDMKESSVNQTSLKISVESKMNFITKAMFGSKIQQIVDKISEQVAKGAAGNFSDISDLTKEI